MQIIQEVSTTVEDKYPQLIQSLLNSKPSSFKIAEGYFKCFMQEVANYRSEIRHNFSEKGFDCSEMESNNRIWNCSSIFYTNAQAAASHFKAFLFSDKANPFQVRSKDDTVSRTELENLRRQLYNIIFTDSTKNFNEIIDKVILDYIVYGYTALQINITEDNDLFFEAVPSSELFCITDRQNNVLLFLRKEKITGVSLYERYDYECKKLSEETIIYHLYISKNSKFFDGKKNSEFEYRIFNDSSLPITERGKPIVRSLDYVPIFCANLFPDSSKFYGNGDGARAITDTLLVNKYAAKLDVSSDQNIQPAWFIDTKTSIRHGVLNVRNNALNYLDVAEGSKDMGIRPVLNAHDARETLNQQAVHEERLVKIFSLRELELISSSRGGKTIIETQTQMQTAMNKISMKAQGIEYPLKEVFKTILKYAFEHNQLETTEKWNDDFFIEIMSKEKEFSDEVERQLTISTMQVLLQTNPLVIKEYAASEKIAENGKSLELIVNEEEFVERQQQQQQQLQQAQEQQQQQQQQ